MKVEINYSAPPVLSRFLDSDAFVRTVVGPVGSGKSSGCVLELPFRAQKQAPGPDGVRRTRFAVIRNTYPELRDTTRKTFEQWVPPQLGTWNEQQFAFRMKYAGVETEILFRALDKPEDVKKLLSLELTGAYINEAREMPKSVFDVLQTRVGRYPSKQQGGPTWFGIWMDTNPWPHGHWLGKLFESPPAGHELFRQPSGRAINAENIENLPAGYYERLCAGKDAEWIRVYVDGQDAAAGVGSYYGRHLEKLQERGGLGYFPLPEKMGVFTSWDLGASDSTAIWFWRINDGAVEFVDHYESNGESMAHYFRVLGTKTKERGYEYLKHQLPHDARAKTLQTGRSIMDMCLAEWGASLITIVPRLDVQDGIQAGRWLLEQEGTRFHPRCSERIDGLDTDGVQCLRDYKRTFNKARQSYSDEPLHDAASHTADGFRYAAVMARLVADSLRQPPKKVPPKVRTSDSFTLDELHEMESASPSPFRRIG